MAHNEQIESSSLPLSHDESEWRTVYQNVEHLREHLNVQMLRNNESIGASQAKFSHVLAVIGVVKHQPNCVLQQYNRHYHWQWQYMKYLEKDGETCPASILVTKIEDKLNVVSTCLLPQGWKCLLQLQTTERWWDWVYIKTSERLQAHLGLFAARDFPRGSIIVFFVQHTIDVAPEANLVVPCSEQNDTTNVCSLKIRNNDGSWQPLVPHTVQDDHPVPLYFGMDYINSACLSFRLGTNAYDDAKKKQNCYIHVDGSVQTIKKIVKDTELLAGYSDNERIHTDLHYIGRNGNRDNGPKHNKRTTSIQEPAARKK